MGILQKQRSEGGTYDPEERWSEWDLPLWDTCLSWSTHSLPEHIHWSIYSKQYKWWVLHICTKNYYIPHILAHSIPHRPTWKIFSHFQQSVFRSSQCIYCVATAVCSLIGMHRWPLLKKMVLFTNLQHFFPLVKGLVCMLAHPKLETDRQPKTY